jgi:hypothetical protein
MPRNGSGVYSHPFPDVVEGTTIESAVFNGNTSDVEQDLNTPRPIVAGGTGANNAHDAMIALSGEIALQQVTNYDSHPFVAGSFWSANATAQPIAGGMSGICHPYGDPNYITIEARQYAAAGTVGRTFVRQKYAGVWDAWAETANTTAGLDAAYVNVAGDTMTGALRVGAPAFATSDGLMVGGAAGSPQSIGFLKNGVKVWSMGLSAADGWFRIGGDSSTGPGGTSCTEALTINPAIYDVAIKSTSASASPTTGALTVAGGLGVGGVIYASGGVIVTGNNIITGYGGTTGAYYFGNTATKYLSYDGTKFVMNGGPLNVTSGDLILDGLSGANTGAVHFGTGGANFLYWNGSSLGISMPTTVPNLTATAGGITVTGNGTLTLQGYSGLPNNGIISFGNQGTHYLYFDGNNYSLPNAGFYCGAINANGGIVAAGAISNSAGGIVSAADVYASAGSLFSRTNGAPTGGAVYLGNANASYMYYSGSAWTLSMFPSYYFQMTQASGLLSYVSNSAASATWNWNGDYTISNNASKPGGGAWLASSDIRIKNDLGDYPRGLADIIQLRPIYYTYKGNDTPEAPAHFKSNPLDENSASKEALTVPYPNSMHLQAAKSATKYVGLVAQEVEPVWPEMVTKKAAYIDGVAVEDLRDIDTTPMIFALINAVKELKAEIDTLKAAR